MTLLPGQPVVFRAVVPLTGWYALQTTLVQGKLAIGRVGPDGQVKVDPGTSDVYSLHPMYLKEGVYLFTFSALGSVPVHVNWILKSKGEDPESLVNSGVGQLAALNLRIVDSSSQPLSPGNPPILLTVADDTSVPSAIPPAAPSESWAVSSPSTSTSTVASPVPSSLLVGVNSSLLGRPASGNSAATPAGLGDLGGSITIAATGQAPLSRIDSDAGEPGEELTTNPTDAQPAQGSPSLSETGQDPAVTLASGSESPGLSRADALALVKADQIAEVVTALKRWFTQGGAANQEQPAIANDDLLASLLDDDAGRPQRSGDASRDFREDRIEHADLGVPTSVIVVAAAAYRLRQLATGWWQRNRNQRVSNRLSRSTDRAGAGPHFGRGFPRASTGPRVVRR
jgi:hypothetical protein